uniref:Uncharacterized protein n=1 Tax=Arundo donax TaxID=35708 RepID=A0A0A8YA22_ARUDO
MHGGRKHYKIEELGIKGGIGSFLPFLHQFILAVC